MFSLITFLLYLTTLSKMVLESTEKQTETILEKCKEEISVTVEEAIKKIKNLLPNDSTDDPTSIILSIISLGGKVKINYGVVTTPTLVQYWGFTVNVSYTFPDKTVWAGVYYGTDPVSVLQQAINGLVEAIQDWKAKNPSY